MRKIYIKNLFKYKNRILYIKTMWIEAALLLSIIKI